MDCHWPRRVYDLVVGVSLAAAAMCLGLGAVGASKNTVIAALPAATLALGALDIRLRRFPPP
jgi:hypothetical protein